MNNMNIAKRAFIISFLYVFIGTISVLSVYPEAPLYGDWVIVTLVLTLPVTFISLGVMYADASAFGLVVLIQLVVFCVLWYVLFRVLDKRQKRSE